MFTKPKNEPTDHEKVIAAAYAKLLTLDPESPEFARIVEQLDKLHKIGPAKDRWMKPDLVLPIIANLVGILAILNHERFHVVTSKAVGFIMKLHV